MRTDRTGLRAGVIVAAGGILTAGLALFAAGQREAPVTNAWLQWGGPHRNFVVESPPLATRWPRGGPRRAWSRSLGDGHSAILVDEDRLYTIYRPAPSGSGQEGADE